MTEWISVKDRQPNEPKRYLVTRYEWQFIDILKWENGDWWDGVNTGVYGVTHWMPLPELPTVTQF